MQEYPLTRPSWEQFSYSGNTINTLDSAIEQAADLVLITDSVGTIEYVNPAFEKLTGYSTEEAIGQTPRMLKSGEQSADLYRELGQTISAGEIYRGVLVNRKKNGESYIVEKTITRSAMRTGGSRISFRTTAISASAAGWKRRCFRRRRCMRSGNWPAASPTTLTIS